MSKRAPTGRMRLQKYLSDTGIASRRHAEEMILAGRVLVNDLIIDTLPAFVEPAHDRVIVDGAPVRPQALAYYLVHKPKGVVCSTRDPAGRPRAVDLLPPLQQRLFPVGRLDEDSSGLLLMTNDGELAQQITHPRYGIPKVYQAEVRGRITTDVPEQLKRGVHLAEGKARAVRVEILRISDKASMLKITLREGRNRQIRRMLARLGFNVRKLKRLEIGPLSLKGLPLGAARRLALSEVRLLREEVAAAVAKAKSHPARRSRSRPRTAREERQKTVTRQPDSARARKPAAPRTKRGTTPSQDQKSTRRIIS
ncbi:MAG: pseudouridine synthase [Planctomycetota bacterium]